MEGASTITICAGFSILAVLLLLFIWIPTIRLRIRLIDSITKFLESHTKDTDNDKN